MRTKLRLEFVLLALAASTFGGCFNGTASDDVTVTQEVTIPSSPTSSVSLAGTTEETFSFTLPNPVDVSSALSKLNGIGTVTLSAPSDLLSGADMSWVDNASVSLTPTTGGMPAGTLVSSGSGSASGLSLPVTMDSATLMQYFSQGPVSVTFTLRANAVNVPAVPPTLTWKLELHGDIAVKKSI